MATSRPAGAGAPNSQKVQKLQAALHAKAKETPSFRFYALYDKVYREDVLAEAFRQCRSNGGAPGVDGQTFEQIAEYGVQRWLGRAPLSPLLANLDMRRHPEGIRLGWKQLGHESQFQARIVNYADDFVILCRGSAEQAMARAPPR